LLQNGKIKITSRLRFKLCTDNYLQVWRNALSLKITASHSRNIGRHKFTKKPVAIRLCVQLESLGLRRHLISIILQTLRNRDVIRAEAPKIFCQL